MVVSDKIAFDSQKKDMHEITYNELKEIYQTLFEQIRTHFKEENEKDEREALRKLGLKVITQWREIVKLGLSEDVLRILETQ
jgi:hemerythrin